MIADWKGTVAVFACSHRDGGNSDHAAGLVAQGVREAGGRADVVTLRLFNVQPCLACRSCARDSLSRCVLREKDQAEELFTILSTAQAVVFCSPIYFYALPSRLKTWIDRSQRFWEARRKGDAWLAALAERPARALFVAGQARGEKLFEGSRLTLKYFLTNFGFVLGEPVGLKGMDARTDVATSAPACDEALALGRALWRESLPRGR